MWVGDRRYRGLLRAVRGVHGAGGSKEGKSHNQSQSVSVRVCRRGQKWLGETGFKARLINDALCTPKTRSRVCRSA